jgi:hypothetical protein
MTFTRSVALAMGLLFVSRAVSARADDLPLPAYSNTFTSDLSRGYWFTSPHDLLVTGLRVPTDIGTQPQNIHIMRLNVAPPFYSASSSDFTTLGYFAGVSGTSFIDTDITIHSGDIVGVLGTRGTGTTMHNSYSTANQFNSSIFGTPVMLKRLLYQGSISTGPATAVSTEDSNPLSRVEFQFQPIPEPSAAALVLVAGAWSLCFGRRKSSLSRRVAVPNRKRAANFC